MTGIAASARRRAAVAALATTVAMLGTFGSVVALGRATDVGDGLVVLGVFLSLSLSRHDQRGSLRERLLRLLTLVVVAVVARWVGETLLHHPDVGDALLVVGLSAPIAIRRWGPAWSRLGTLMSLPLVAVLTTPVIGAPGRHDAWWGPVVATAAWLWVTATQELSHRWGTPLHESTTAPRAVARGTRRGSMRPSAPTRMALQMALALAVAFVVGRSFFGHHWAWVVITAFVVSAGNRGRGDVVHKGVLRLTGALVGTAGATLVAGTVSPGSHGAVAGMLAVLAVASALRPFGYGWWAAGITAALALLYGYAGEGGTSVLAERLIGILVGGVLAVGVSWWVLPVPTTTVLRGRVAAVLSSLQDVLAALRDPDLDRGASFDELDLALRQAALHLPAARAQRRVRRASPTAADTLEALQSWRPVADRLAAGRFETPDGRRAAGLTARELGEVRRQLRDSPDVASLVPALKDLSSRLERLADEGLEPSL